MKSGYLFEISTLKHHIIIDRALDGVFNKSQPQHKLEYRGDENKSYNEG